MQLIKAIIIGNRFNNETSKEILMDSFLGLLIWSTNKKILGNAQIKKTSWESIAIQEYKLIKKIDLNRFILLSLKSFNDKRQRPYRNTIKISFLIK